MQRERDQAPSRYVLEVRPALPLRRVSRPVASEATVGVTLREARSALPGYRVVVSKCKPGVDYAYEASAGRPIEAGRMRTNEDGPVYISLRPTKAEALDALVAYVRASETV